MLDGLDNLSSCAKIFQCFVGAGVSPPDSCRENAGGETHPYKVREKICLLMHDYLVVSAVPFHRANCAPIFDFWLLHF